MNKFEELEAEAILDWKYAKAKSGKVDQKVRVGCVSQTGCLHK